MILRFDHRGAVSLETDNVTAAYDCSEVLSDMTGSGSSQEASPVRLVVELARNLGGEGCAGMRRSFRCRTGYCASIGRAMT